MFRLFIFSVYLIISLQQTLFGSEWITHGFLSKGYMNSSAHNYLAESNGGTYQFTEYGINFMRQVNKDLRVGAQLFGRDLGDIGNSRLNLDWMYADLRLSGSLRLRVGKMFTPMGFHSEGRDIDLLRSTVLLPQSVYFDTFRDNFAFNGVVLQGDQPLLEGLLDFKLFR
ncbi:hypothetical protein HOF92_03220, partial [bacterium]|nr:hypothetical protein [bacterium]